MIIMKDFKAISNTIKNELKHKIFGKSNYGNTDWEKASFEWYEKIHDENTQLHTNFAEYLNSKQKFIQTVLEVGCGTGVYPIKYKELFNNLKYTGLDFSKPNIEFCKQHSDFEFIQGDFIKINLDKKYDLVYSHAVIDHVYDIDEFLRRIVKLCGKYAYVNAYRGFFPNLDDHKMNWRENDHCYYNDLSIIKTKKVLLDTGLSEDEFLIRKQENKNSTGKILDQTVIEVFLKK